LATGGILSGQALMKRRRHAIATSAMPSAAAVEGSGTIANVPAASVEAVMFNSPAPVCQVAGSLATLSPPKVSWASSVLRKG